MYVQVPTEKEKDRSESTYKKEKSKIMQNRRYNVNERLLESGELKPITENELQNKKSDEEATQKQIFLDSKAAKNRKPSSVQHVKQSVMSEINLRKISSLQSNHLNKLKPK